MSARLRVAAVASDAAAHSRLAALIRQSGHELVDIGASPDAVLSDGTTESPAPAPAVALGATDEDFAGMLPADASVTQIDAALRAVAAGLTVRVSSQHDRHFGPLPEEPAILLTPREIEVLGALSNGFSNKAVARHLGISPHTVKFHIESLFKKLGAGSRAEAVAKGLKWQIVEF